MDRETLVRSFTDDDYLVVVTKEGRRIVGHLQKIDLKEGRIILWGSNPNQGPGLIGCALDEIDTVSKLEY